MNKKYVIYKATNKINGKSYIGKTYNFEKRKKEHFYDIENGLPFHKALKKYGLENFEWEVIDHADSDSEIREKEVYWINYYRTCISFSDCNGYNLTLGGEGGVSWNSKPVMRYDLDGNYIDEFVSCSHASIELDLDRKSIIRAAKTKYSQSGGYQWKFKNDLKEIKPYKRAESVRKVKILKLDLKGNVLNEYSSVNEAAIKNNLHRSCISACLTGKSLRCGNFLWIYKDQYKKENDYSFKGIREGKGIVQLDDDFNVINHFNNCTEAARFLNEPDKVHKQIHKALTSNKRCRGFYWRKADNIFDFNM